MVNQEYIKNNNLAKLFPQLALEWDYEKNNDITPEQVSAHTAKKVWWKCTNGHSYESQVCNRTDSKNKTACPYCQNRKVLAGFNDLQSQFPQIAAEWDYEKNAPNTPQMYGKKSNQKVWWICSKGHRFQAIIGNRTKNGTGCPYCSGRNVVLGETDLVTKFPQIAAEWDYAKNAINPHEVPAHSNKSFWWRCKLNHGYMARVNNRINGTGCPYCAGKRVLQGFNDLVSNYPNLAAEWDYERNTGLSPDKVTGGSNKRVWWKCPLEHSYEATINHRTCSNTGCPICANETQTSFREQVIFYYIKSIFPNAISRHKMFSREIDVFIPSISVGVEYDGEYYHSNDLSAADLEKAAYLADKGIRLIRIKETTDLLVDYNSDVITISKDKPDFSYAIEQLCKRLSIKKIDVNIERDRVAIMALFYSGIKENSLAIQYPDLLAEWDYSKNAGLNPYFVPKSTDRKVWWKCSLGHSYEATPNHRTSSSTGCPYCSNHKVFPGFNDLLTRYPNIAELWDYDRNESLSPQTVLPRSHKKVWWKCPNGHSYLRALSSMTSPTLKCLCPECKRGLDDETLAVERAVSSLT